MLGALLLLCAVFAVLKLTGNFAYGWIMVFFPVWFPAAGLVFVCVCVTPALWREERKKGKRR
jgi:hypothetical protein